MEFTFRHTSTTVFVNLNRPKAIQKLQKPRARTHAAFALLPSRSASKYSNCRSAMIGLATCSYDFREHKNSATDCMKDPGGQLMRCLPVKRTLPSKSRILNPDFASRAFSRRSDS